MLKLDDFIAQSDLYRAVVDQFGGKESFLECYNDVNEHGIAGGFPGFIYYADTVAFTETFWVDIREYLQEYTSELGLAGWLKTLPAMKGYTTADIEDGLYEEDSEHKVQVKNLIAWVVAELVCMDFADY